MSGGEGKMLGLSVKQHKRSKSFPEKKRVEEDDLDSSGEASDLVKLDMGQFKGHVTTKKKQSPTMEVHNSLKQEVRVYTPKRVYQDLEAAKDEYIRATFGVRKDHKILLPKIVEAFAKSSGLCPVGVLEMIQQTLPESSRKSVKKCQLGKPRKSIEYIPHNFTFRYLISKELVK